MNVLGIETATDVCSIGIVSGERRFERSLRESRIHSEKLLVVLSEVLEEASLKWAGIQAVALSSGPGSFTGLRIGASTVKGLLSPENRPFVKVPTFDGISSAYLREHGPVKGHMICLDAKQDEWYVQKIGSDGIRGPISLIGTSLLMGQIAGSVVLTDVPNRFHEHNGVFDLHRWCSGTAIADVGRQKLEEGARDDVRVFEPSYWKEFVVRTVPKAVRPQPEAKEK